MVAGTIEWSPATLPTQMYLSEMILSLSTEKHCKLLRDINVILPTLYILMKSCVEIEIEMKENRKKTE